MHLLFREHSLSGRADSGSGRSGRSERRVARENPTTPLLMCLMYKLYQRRNVFAEVLRWVELEGGGENRHTKEWEQYPRRSTRNADNFPAQFDA